MGARTHLIGQLSLRPIRRVGLTFGAVLLLAGCPHPDTPGELVVVSVDGMVSFGISGCSSDEHVASSVSIHALTREQNPPDHLVVSGEFDSDGLLELDADESKEILSRLPEWGDADLEIVALTRRTSGSGMMEYQVGTKANVIEQELESTVILVNGRGLDHLPTDLCRPTGLLVN
jgi:hypothetical protein